MLAGTTAQAGDVVLGTVGIEVTGTYGHATVDAEALGKSSGAIATALDTAANNGAITLTYSQADQSWKLGGANVSAEELADAGITISTTDGPNNDETIILTKKLVANPDLAETGVTYDATTVTATNLAEVSVGDDVKATIKVDENGVATLEEYDDTYVPDAISLDLHVGADSSSDNKIEMKIDSMSSKAIGVDGLLVNGKDSTNADAAIDTISAAIQKVSTQRSALGAVQNRLEHTINNLDNVVENTTAAESQIRDTDMATEMVKYSNNQILAQAGQAMLAQANQANQGVLSLLS